ncbi:MAG TPA: hypothetical protein VNI20_08010 [Fimbriimonadaceae bacterium]|nr:hypothetical protein [Fimbriimonadaceae bacterium]
MNRRWRLLAFLGTVAVLAIGFLFLANPPAPFPFLKGARYDGTMVEDMYPPDPHHVTIHEGSDGIQAEVFYFLPETADVVRSKITEKTLLPTWGRSWHNGVLESYSNSIAHEIVTLTVVPGGTEVSFRHDPRFMDRVRARITHFLRSGKRLPSSRDIEL